MPTTSDETTQHPVSRARETRVADAALPPSLSRRWRQDVIQRIAEHRRPAPSGLPRESRVVGVVADVYSKPRPAGLKDRHADSCLNAALIRTPLRVDAGDCPSAQHKRHVPDEGLTALEHPDNHRNREATQGHCQLTDLRIIERTRTRGYRLAVIAMAMQVCLRKDREASALARRPGNVLCNHSGDRTRIIENRLFLERRNPHRPTIRTAIQPRRTLSKDTPGARDTASPAHQGVDQWLTTDTARLRQNWKPPAP